MSKVTYNTKLIFNDDSDKQKLFTVLESERLAFNCASKIKFDIKNNSIVELHSKFYQDFRKSQPQIPSQVVIAAENECLSAYRSIKSNKQKLDKPPEKKKLSIRLDKRTFSFKRINDGFVFSIISLEKRVKCSPYIYPKLRELLNTYKFCDPLLFIKDDDVWIALTFNLPDVVLKQESACGVDLGCRMAAVTSDGHFYQDKKFNKEKRNLRFLKRKLQSSGTKSARKHLKKLRRKEHNKNKNQTYKLANTILSNTKSDVIVLEDLSNLKTKKHKYQNKNHISQVPFYQIRLVLTQKAPIYGKTVICVSPSYTSQIDHRTNKKDGVRKGRRYYAKDGVVLDADQNASINIAKRSKLPVSYLTILDGQVVVTQPNDSRKVINVCKSRISQDVKVLQAPAFSRG